MSTAPSAAAATPRHSGSRRLPRGRRIDRDPRAIAAARALADSFAGRLHLVEGRFGEMVDLLAAQGRRDALDGVALDLGVSSMQLDEAERGFSFRGDGPLDMRMERRRHDRGRPRQ